MRRPLLATLLALSTLSLAPSALAAPACAVGDEQPAYVALEGARVAVYEESNGVPGLQTAACDHEGETKQPDRLVQRTPAPPTIPEHVCVRPQPTLSLCLT